MPKSSMLRFIRYLVRNFPRSSLAYIAITLFSALLDASTVLLIAPIFDLLMSNNAPIHEVQVSSATHYVLDLLKVWHLPQSALTVMFLFLGVVVIRNFFLIASDVFSIFIKERTIYKLKIAVFQSVLNANWSFYLQRNQGSFLNILTREIVQTQYAFVHFSYCVTYSFQIALFIAVALWVSWQLTFLCVGIGFGLIAPFVLLMRWNYRWGEKTVIYASEANGIIQETFALAKVIQSFWNQNIILNRLRRAQRELFKNTLFSQSLTAAIHHTYYPLGLLTVVLGYYISIQMKLSFSELSMILFAMWKSMPVLASLTKILSSLSETLPSFDKILDLQLDAQTHQIQSGAQPFQGFANQITLKQFNFKYPGSEQPVLKDINLLIPKGKMVALVGRSGSGKSTLVDILMGFYPDYTGKFEVDNTPFCQFELSSYRKKIGYVPQNSLLFNTSIRNNFLWIHPQLSESEMLWACQQAHALEFIEALEDGFDTIVGDRGVRLSGGQVQRLALARAIAIKPELLILDEATSALDSESENYIQQSIESLAENMTILVIAHRLTTIKKADYVYVLEQGEIIEAGKLSDLEAAEGAFKHMLAQQNLS